MRLLLYSFIISFIWGISPIFYKLLLNNIDMKLFFIINNLIFAFCVIAYMIYYWEHCSIEIKTINSYDILKIILFTIILSFIPTIIYYNLINKHELYMVTALISASPVFTISLSYFLLNENVSKYGVIGLVLICIGIICLTY